MAVQSGEIHGFLGPNGSGKTTTLRILLSLVRPDRGELRLLGQPLPAGKAAVASRVGAIVEGPQFFGSFTARSTMEILARVGGVRRERVAEVLDLVGLGDRGDDRVRTYSLGMKQRLALATALLKSPELLILDEPANGLDPAGIREMGGLLRNLIAAGTTVVLSSHILAEIQQICDSVTIIAHGRRVASGPVAEVLASQDKGEYRVRVGDPAQAAEVLAAAGATVRAVADHLVVSDVAGAEWISSTLGGRQLWASEIVALTPDLESVFLQLTEGVTG